MADRTAWVAGATGLVGGHLVRQLAADPAYGRVIALGRRPLAAFPPRVETRIVDFDHLPAFDLPRPDDVYCALGTTIRAAGSQAAFRRVDHEYVLALARRAAALGAARFLLVTSIGASPRSRVFYSRVKGDVERDVAAVAFRGGLHIFRPSFLLGERAERRAGERVGIAVFRAVAPLLVGPARKYRPIAAETVARAMRAAARREGTGVRVYESDEIARLGGPTP
jgi:uncharacterized protein YbjT (DUF2867 family)